MRYFDYESDFLKIELVCEHRNTRYGFAHDCRMLAYDLGGEYEPLAKKVSAYYTNRTWERYDYQSVILKALKAAQDSYESSLLAMFKRFKGYSRMTAKRREEFRQWAFELASGNTSNTARLYYEYKAAYFHFDKIECNRYLEDEYGLYASDWLKAYDCALKSTPWLEYADTVTPSCTEISDFLEAQYGLTPDSGDEYAAAETEILNSLKSTR